MGGWWNTNIIYFTKHADAGNAPAHGGTFIATSCGENGTDNDGASHGSELCRSCRRPVCCRLRAHTACLLSAAYAGAGRLAAARTYRTGSSSNDSQYISVTMAGLPSKIITPSPGNAWKSLVMPPIKPGRSGPPTTKL